MLLSEVVGTEQLAAANQKLCDWFEKHIWFSLVGLMSEEGTKIGNMVDIDQILTVLGQWLQRFQLDFLGQFL